MCAPGYIPQDDKKACVLTSQNSIYKRCVVAKAGQAGCSVCDPTSVVAGDLSCVLKGTIANCAKYASGLACSECVSGYGVKSGACVAGSVSNCEQYEPENPSLCSTCLPNFFLSMVGNGSSPVCVPFGLKNDCSKIVLGKAGTSSYYSKLPFTC